MTRVWSRWLAALPLLALTACSGETVTQIVVSIATLLHRLAPPDFVHGNSFVLSAGDRLAPEAFTGRLLEAGYRRVAQVMEHGGYAQRGALWVVVRRGSWLARHWRYSTTLGHVIILQAAHQRTRVMTHELVHVLQMEGRALHGWALGGLQVALLHLGAEWAVLPTAVLSATWLSYGAASAAAWLRGGRPYLDNAWERHARAETGEPL